MRYLTGIFALNIEDETLCCGDWHTSAIDWKKIEGGIKESDSSIFGNWGIELNKKIPFTDERCNVANTLRAVVDIMESGDTRFLKGFRDDFIMVDDYNDELFSKVILLRENPHWDNINKLMCKEFMYDWDNYIESVSHN